MRYNALMSDSSFLRVRERASRLGLSLNLLSINYSDNEYQFLTKSESRPGVVWTQRIMLQGILTPEQVVKMNERDLQQRILDGHIKIHCNCEAFTYFGFAYNAWMHGYGLVRETRRPVVRNPQGRGFVCKHLYAIMNSWKFYAPMIAGRYKEWYEKNNSQQSLTASQNS